jgi:two-component system sensor histidine kinase UhpB
MSLRLKIHLIVGLLTASFVLAICALQFVAMRDSVREEVVAANRVATQILKRLSWVQAAQGAPGMFAFLQGLGRVRSTDLALFDSSGTLLYRSPESPYKAGRDAPAWFDRLMAPPISPQVLDFPDGRLELRANASRAVLDAWDALVEFAGVGLALLLLVNALVFWQLGRAVRPFARIVPALRSLEGGDFGTRLPPLAGREASAIGAGFNRMAAALADHIETERRAARAELQLSDQRELARWASQRVEEERRMIARELHDEFGQSVTAIRSMALSVAQRTEAGDPASAQAARLIAEESARLYDAMHGLIPRLTPVVLDQLGLPDALADLAERTRAAHPGVVVDVEVAPGDGPLGPDLALAIYRAAQEGMTNALRHGQARRLLVAVSGDAHRVRLDLVDDGAGLAADWHGRPGHHGLRWLHERAVALAGRFEVAPAEGGRGTRLTMELPRAPSSATPPAQAKPARAQEAAP